jgi:hypothetical protein
MLGQLGHCLVVAGVGCAASLVGAAHLAPYPRPQLRRNTLSAELLEAVGGGEAPLTRVGSPLDPLTLLSLYAACARLLLLAGDCYFEAVSVKEVDALGGGDSGGVSEGLH